VFYNSLVDITYELADRIRNPDDKEKTMHLEARGKDVVILGNAKAEKYRSFKITMAPVLNRLQPQEF
jgi:hypothetical protein